MKKTSHAFSLIKWLKAEEAASLKPEFAWKAHFLTRLILLVNSIQTLTSKQNKLRFYGGLCSRWFLAASHFESWNKCCISNLTLSQKENKLIPPHINPSCGSNYAYFCTQKHLYIYITLNSLFCCCELFINWNHFLPLWFISHIKTLWISIFVEKLTKTQICMKQT